MDTLNCVMPLVLIFIEIQQIKMVIIILTLNNNNYVAEVAVLSVIKVKKIENSYNSYACIIIFIGLVIECTLVSLFCVCRKKLRDNGSLIM